MRHENYELLQVMIRRKIEEEKGIGTEKLSWLRYIKEWITKNGATLIHTAHNKDDYAITVDNLIGDDTINRGFSDVTFDTPKTLKSVDYTLFFIREKYLLSKNFVR